MKAFHPFEESKVWGTVTHMHLSPSTAVSILRMLPNTYCSRHYHQERANLFYVRHGRVRIESWGSSEVIAEPIGEPDFWVLSEGDTITIPSRIWHRFVVLRDHSEMVEVYWPDRGSIVRMDDIYRYDVGGDNEA